MLELPDPDDIAKMDEMSVVVEIKTGSAYRAYKYSGVVTNKKNNYRKLLGICTILSKEFDIDLINYYRP